MRMVKKRKGCFWKGGGISVSDYVMGAVKEGRRGVGGEKGDLHRDKRRSNPRLNPPGSRS